MLKKNIQKIKVWWNKIKYYWSLEKCYSDREQEGIAVFGLCSELAGGSSATEYLSEECITCPYFFNDK